MLDGRTILIPKQVGTTDPASHRPITVSSVLTRLYNKILAGRLADSCPPSDRQKAFRKGDRLLENVVLLRSVIGYRLAAIGYRLAAIGYRLAAIDYLLAAIG